MIERTSVIVPAKIIRTFTLTYTVLALTACGSPATVEKPTTSAQIQVLSSTNVYADLAQQIGKELVKSTSIISSSAQDPHSYEASARDKLAMSNADLIISNGGGYDSFMDTLATDLKVKDQSFLSALEYSQHNQESAKAAPHDEHLHETETEHAEHQHAHSGTNEHIWYDPDSMKHVAEEINIRLAALTPEKNDFFTANTAALLKELDALENKIHALEPKTTDLHFAMTEPVPLHLLTSLGMENSTPAGFSEAIEGGSGVSPRAFKEFSTLLENGKIDLLAYNPQTASPQTERLKALALKANIPVIDFLETLPAERSYTQWMEENLAALEAKLG
ncbi:ABC transporter substrate-binding protein [Arthrobacter sp. MYb227]|uniref:metal ABC transporter solute-binding protein, Zn/Mn family n=1 Tax=Arthrobacter sp. MYb227 TaxID=1848601 RepID=UPI000CFC03FC|nr:zinc ABC transporter substrate-binding protein [Arthrobacter sp. MYb227]PQZ85747.1 ABC transporter substrate-binding protein [Arthrobacter sp. MYb227]